MTILTTTYNHLISEAVVAITQRYTIPNFLSTELLSTILREKAGFLNASQAKFANYKNKSDVKLISLINADDHDAFEFMYRTYVHQLYAFARKNISSKEDCQEIVHDIFLDLWQRRNKLLHVTSIKGYLFSAVRYKMIRYIQHSKVKLTYRDHFIAFETHYQSPVIDENVVDIRALILQGIADLPARCQQVVELRLENLSNAEIADRMSITKRSVENYIVTALRHLRKKNILGNL